MAAPSGARRDGVRAAALLAGFAIAVLLRLAVSGATAPVGAARSAPAGLAVAAALAALAVADRTATPRPSLRQLAVALLGAAVLVLPVAASRLLGATGGHRPQGAFLAWALVVSAVAVAEEAFLRGALLHRLDALAGPTVAVAVTAACFAALHVPLYGWAAVPLDLAVGGWLGWLRLAAGSWLAPAGAHAAADLLAWWLR
ncbi:MAG: type II CAAX prenyl endopeptidase Rce1 family protein [Frankiaceae bacterium]